MPGTSRLIGLSASIGFHGALEALISHRERIVLFNRKFLSDRPGHVWPLFLHEQGHVLHIEALARGDYGDRLIKQVGKLFEEFKAGDTSDMVFPPQIDYIEEHSGEVFLREFLAEVIRVSVKYPDQAQKAFPNVYAEVQGLIEHLGGKAQNGAVSPTGGATGVQEEPPDTEPAQTVKDAFPNFIGSDERCARARLGPGRQPFSAAISAVQIRMASGPAR